MGHQRKVGGFFMFMDKFETVKGIFKQLYLRNPTAWHKSFVKKHGKESKREFETWLNK